MQDPSTTRIPDNPAPLEATAAPAAPAAPETKFPLPDHECDRQGVPTLHSGEWDYADVNDLSYQIVLNAVQRMGRPLAMVRLYLGDKLMQVVEDANLPQEPYNEAMRIWRWFVDLQVVEDDLNSS